MIVKLLTEHHLEFLSLKGGCRGSSETTHVKCHIVGNLMHWLIKDSVQTGWIPLLSRVFALCTLILLVLSRHGFIIIILRKYSEDSSIQKMLAFL